MDFYTTQISKLAHFKRTMRLQNNLLTKLPEELWIFPALQFIFLWKRYRGIYIQFSGFSPRKYFFYAQEKMVRLGPMIKMIEPEVFVGSFTNLLFFIKMYGKLCKLLFGLR